MGLPAAPFLLLLLLGIAAAADHVPLHERFTYDASVDDFSYLGMLSRRDTCSQALGPGARSGVCDPSLTVCCTKPGHSFPSCENILGKGWCCSGNDPVDRCYVDQASACGEKNSNKCSNAKAGSKDVCCPEFSICDDSVAATEDFVRCYVDRGYLVAAASDISESKSAAASKSRTTSATTSTRKGASSSTSKPKSGVASTSSTNLAKASSKSSTKSAMDSSTSSSSRTMKTVTTTTARIAKTTHTAQTTTTQATATAQAASSSGLSGGAIAGIVIGVVIAVALIGLLPFFLIWRKKKRLNQATNETAPPAAAASSAPPPVMEQQQQQQHHPPPPEPSRQLHSPQGYYPPLVDASQSQNPYYAVSPYGSSPEPHQASGASGSVSSPSEMTETRNLVELEGGGSSVNRSLRST